ncbi:MAG: alpha-glucosidase [Ilumatobacteraceae bacterium]
MQWWKDAVVYQVYPRSFADSNGDGIGDLRGIIDHVDHLVELGIDCVWLSPHFDSPNPDNGYDIRDYRKVMTEFGTMADFDELLAVLAGHGIRLVLDLVVNHTSDEHEWFVASRSSVDNPFRDFYIWRDGVGDGPPNNYPAFFGGSAWERDDATGQWYLHYFAPQQPDLNWENPQVRAEVYDLMRFWLDKGVAGFRMDVIPFISKQPDLPDLVGLERHNPQNVYASGPRVHEFLHEMHREVLAPYDAVSIGEAFGVTVDNAHLFTDADRGELSMIFHFDLMRLGRRHWRDDGWTVPGFVQALCDIDAASGPRGWNTSFLCNHDNPRAVSRFGDDAPGWRERSAAALATVSLLQRATPFVYQGDELGMTNYPFTSIEQYDDVEVKGLWRGFVETGRVTAEELLHHLARTSRDHARTPMQWSAARHGGFTTGTPWLVVHPNHVDVNAAEQRARGHSVFHHYRRLVAQRRAEPTLVHGTLVDLAPGHEQVVLLGRELDGRRFVVAANFGRKANEVPLPDGWSAGEVRYSNVEAPSIVDGSLRLEGWQSVVLSVD